MALITLFLLMAFMTYSNLERQRGLSGKPPFPKAIPYLLIGMAIANVVISIANAL